MKRLLFLLLGTCTGATALAQSSPDLIVNLTGDNIRATVTELTETSVKFRYPNETLINTISRNVVQEIQFASGRVQKISERINVQGEQDWPNVKVTTLESDVAGLTKLGEVRSRAFGTIFSGLTRVDERAIVKLKKEAARLGAPVVLIQSKTSAHLAPESAITGIAYGYPTGKSQAGVVNAPPGTN